MTVQKTTLGNQRQALACVEEAILLMESASRLLGGVPAVADHALRTALERADMASLAIKDGIRA